MAFDRWLRNMRAVVVMAAAVAAWGQSTRGEEPMFKIPTISVTGTGKIAARPDVAEISVGVLAQAPTAQVALSLNNESMNRLVATLKERGIAEKDIQTSQVQVAPEYSRPHPRGPQDPVEEFVPRIVGYRVDNMVRIAARKIDQLGPLLDAVVQAGANQIHGISFRIEHDDQLLDEARKRAMADAKHKAALLAGEAGVVVGAPLKIEETGAENSPQPRFMGVGKMMATAAAPMPVSPGEQEISVTVSVVYELKAPK